MNHIYDMIAPSHCVIPPTNPTSPTEADLTITSNIGGTLTFDLADPITRPLGTRFQIIRGLVSSNAAVGTVVYDGVTQHVDLAAPTSAHFYWSRTYANSFFGPYYPNTTGISATASGTNAGQAVPNAYTYVTQVNCTVTQTFSKGPGAFFGQELGRVDFTPQAEDATVQVTATFRAGIGNFFSLNRVGLDFVTGVSSVYTAPVAYPNGGSASDLRPSVIQAQFSYAATNGAYARLFWDTNSGPNSMVIDNISLKGEFIKR